MTSKAPRYTFGVDLGAPEGGRLAVTITEPKRTEIFGDVRYVTTFSGATADAIAWLIAERDRLAARVKELERNETRKDHS